MHFNLLGQLGFSCRPGVVIVFPFTHKDIPVWMINYMATLLICHDYKAGVYLIGGGVNKKETSLDSGYRNNPFTAKFCRDSYTPPKFLSTLL